MRYDSPVPPDQVEAVMAAHDALSTKVKALSTELPGVTFGYIGNVGVDRSGPYDDRSWRVFLPHPGRVGQSFRDDVHLGHTTQLIDALAKWPKIEEQARERYHAENRQQPSSDQAVAERKQNQYQQGY